jgi:hypothetical protein
MTIEQSTEIEILPPRRPVQSEAIGQLMQHAAAMTAAKQVADALCDSDLVPATYKGKPGNGAAAILYGAELGLNPIQSLQQIFVVHGTPAIYARTAVALVKAHGIIIETVSSTNDAVTVRGTDTRTGQVEQSTWDIPRAELAGYTTNKKYQTDPQAMLYAKAAMEVCRKIAPDVLLGVVYAREELELDEQPRRVGSSRRGVEGLRQAIAPQQQPEPVDVTPDEPADRKKLNSHMHALFGDAGLPTARREDRLTITRKVVGRSDIASANDLTLDEIGGLVARLDEWKRDGSLTDKVCDLLDMAALEAESKP